MEAGKEAEEAEAESKEEARHVVFCVCAVDFKTFFGCTQKHICYFFMTCLTEMELNSFTFNGHQYKLGASMRSMLPMPETFPWAADHVLARQKFLVGYWVLVFLHIFYFYLFVCVFVFWKLLVGILLLDASVLLLQAWVAQTSARYPAFL